MDPITAIGLASAILSFIDFAHKVATGADELYKSVPGATEENIHADTIAKDLDEAAVDLTNLSGKTKHEKALNNLATECRKVSGDLLRLLNKLTLSGDRSTWKALKVAIRNLRKEGEVAKMVDRLNGYRSQILLRLSLMLNDQQCSIKLQLDQLGDKGLSLSTESAALLTKLREDILKNVTQLKDNQEELVETSSEVRDNILGVRQSLKTLSSMMTIVPKENIILQNLFFPSINTREESMNSAADGTFGWIFEEEKVHPHQVEDELNALKHSNYSSDVSRSPSVSSEPDQFALENENLETGSSADNWAQNSRPPSRDSAEDVFETTNKLKADYDRSYKIQQIESVERATARTNFLTWLRSGEGVFHISGKAGSGKSTLMKFLCSHKRTKEELQVWAGKERKLVFARFYFWKSSDDSLQMSLPGLQRSILFETLKYCPDLVPELFKRQWEILRNSVPYIPGNLINDSDVQNAFEALTRKGSFSQYRFCFFVDGLDEYQGQMLHRRRLTADLQRWASGGDVKICASSRPYIEFDKLVTSDSRRIHLHELTTYDIYLFSRKMIENNLEDDLDRVKGYYLRLVEKVVEKAEGVFLWARLVVCSLLEAFFRHDTEEVLENKLDVLPPSINDLYTELLNTLSPDDRVRAEKMMLLTAHNPFREPLNCVVYAFIDQLSNPRFPPRDGKKPASWGSASEMAKDVQLQLKSLTKGLLETAPLWTSLGEVTENRTVGFFHRTVRDFVHEHLKLGDTARQFPNLIEVETYYRLWLAELILADRPARVEAWNQLLQFGGIDDRFEQEIPVDLLEGFNCVLEDAPDDDSMDFFTGLNRGIRRWDSRLGVSFTCLAAYCGQQEFVLQQTAKNPELLRGNGESHILLSAAVSVKTDLVRALLKKGSSPMDCVTWKKVDDGLSSTVTQTQAVPIWMVFMVFLMHYNYGRKPYEKVGYEILELFLHDKRVDTSSCLFYFYKPFDESATHWFTLKQLIQDVKPDNVDQLLALLKRGSGNSYFNSARLFLSKFIPFFKQTESTVEKESCGFSSDRQCDFFICGDLKVDCDWVFASY